MSKKKKNKTELVLDHEAFQKLLNDPFYRKFPEELPYCVWKKVKKNKKSN